MTTLISDDDTTTPSVTSLDLWLSPFDHDLLELNASDRLGLSFDRILYGDRMVLLFPDYVVEVLRDWIHFFEEEDVHWPQLFIESLYEVLPIDFMVPVEFQINMIDEMGTVPGIYGF